MTPPLDEASGRLLRDLAPQVLGAVLRRFGDFGAAEDAVQEALIAAATQWPREGRPDNPRGWLIRVASRRMTDHLRNEHARRRREDLTLARTASDALVIPAPDAGLPIEQDDSLVLLFMCCHPALSRTSAIALTLRAVGGLTTAEIAQAFLVPTPTMAQRISRAKESIRASGVSFALPTDEDRNVRLAAVLHVLYLIFNEGYTSTAGDHLHRTDLSNEAIRLARGLHEQLPSDPEVTGLLALMLLTDARRPARTGPEGELIPLDEQDRSLWDTAAVAEGVALVTGAIARGAVGPYQLQAAIAAVHDQSASHEDTDWEDILGLYTLLERMSPNPMVSLNRTIALAMVHGPAAGLAQLDTLARDPRLASHHRLDAVRAHLLERAGDRAGAARHYRAAAERTASLPERNYLVLRAARVEER